MSDNFQQLQQLTEQPAAVKWFDGLFERAHVEITDTGEQFTVLHRGDSVEVQQGLDGEKPNLIIPLQSENVRNLVGFFQDEEIGDYEQYRIVKFMVKPCLQAALEMPILQNPAFRKVMRLDTQWQQALIAPDGSEDEQLTVTCENNEWKITPGFHGTPQRQLRFTPEQALEYQRRIFEANSKNSLPVWLQVGGWYVKFRDSVTVAS
jgi:hypothetical protein